MKKFAIILFSLTIFALFFYSFTQVDLGLTITRNLFLEHIERSFQSVGYFNRHLSTYLYMGLLFFLFLSYVFLVRLVREGKLSEKTLRKIIIGTAIFLAFSYTAFSYDIFNYIFDAKILTHYHQNPYQHKALDYPGDPMLGFMHWTHRNYPYGPLWLVITVPLSFIGLNYFLPTYFLFKFLAAASYIGTTFYIGKILGKIKPDVKLLGMAVFACNPLVIIEALVSGHNDIVMLFFAVVGLYYYICHKKGKGSIFWLISVLIKYATLALFPVFIFLRFTKNKKLSWEKIFIISLFLMVGALLAVSYRTTYQPWYLLYLLPFTALLSDREYVFLPTLIFSAVSLFTYVPFLFLGNWNPPVPTILLQIEIGGVIVSGIVAVLLWLIERRFSHS